MNSSHQFSQISNDQFSSQLTNENNSCKIKTELAQSRNKKLK